MLFQCVISLNQNCFYSKLLHHILTKAKLAINTLFHSENRFELLEQHHLQHSGGGKARPNGNKTRVQALEPILRHDLKRNKHSIIVIFSVIYKLLKHVFRPDNT